MSKNIFIFDLDGTLVDTLESLSTSINRMMDKLGLENISKVKCRDFVGNGARVLVEKSLQSVMDKVEIDFLNKAEKIYYEEFSQYCTYKVVPYDGVEELLNALKLKGCILAVLTNKPHEQAVVAVEEIFGKEMFDLIQGQVNGLPRKPDPKSLWDVIDKLNGDINKCVFVGDSEVDIKTGKTADVFTVGVTWGFRDEAVLKAENADLIVHKASEILKVFE